MGGRRPERTETVARTELSPQQQQILNPLISTFAEFGRNPPEPFRGTRVAPTTEAENLSRIMALQTAGAVNPAIQGGLQAQQDIQSAAGAGRQGLDAILGNLAAAQPLIQAFLSGDFGATGQFSSGANPSSGAGGFDPQTDQLLQAAISAAINPVITDFNQQVLPGLSDQAIASGQFGGTRQGIAQGLAADALLRNAGNIGATLSNDAAQQARQLASNESIAGAQLQSNEALAGLGAQSGLLGQLIGAGTDAAQTGLQTGTAGLLALPQTLQTSLLPASVVEQVGLAQRADTQANIDAERALFQEEQLLPFLAAQEAARVALGLPGGPTTVVSERDPGSPGFLRGALGGIIGGAGAGAGFGPFGALGGGLLGGLVGGFGS